MRVLIVGASGFIGRYLARRLGSDGRRQVYCTFRSRPPGDDRNHWYQLELTDSMGLEKLFSLIRPDTVVHLAAMADVGTAEREREQATAVNVTATGAIAGLCEESGANLVFVSTEYVFDGQSGLYGEEDLPNPTTHYGRTKLAAEYAVARLSGRGAVLRTSIVYGWPAPGRRNFVPYLVERLRRGEAYAAGTEVMRSPIYVEHLAEGIAGLAQDFHPGVHHLAGRDWVSMYDFALAVADAFGLDRTLVKPINSDTANPDTANPDRLGLDCADTVRRLGLEQAGLAEGLAAMRESPDTPFAG